MNRKKIIYFIFLILVLLAIFISTRSPAKPVAAPEPSATPAEGASVKPTAKPVTQDIWSNWLSEIRTILKSNITDIAIEDSRPISIYKQEDITGDGIPEALVDIGTGGAYTEDYVLMMMEKGKPVLAKFKEQDSTVDESEFSEGASVRHGEAIVMLPDQNAIYQGSWSTDTNAKIDSCTVDAYKWNSKTGLFEYDSGLGILLAADFCKKIGS